MRFAISLLLLAPLVAAAQEKKTPAKIVPLAEIKLDRKDQIAYEKEIEPIFANKCLFCHSGNVIESKFDMSTYEKVMKGGKRMAAIQAGNAAESLLYKMCSRKMTPVMPPIKEEGLTPQELALIKLWIDQGAKPPTSKIDKPKVIVGVPPANVRPVRAVSVTGDGKTIAASRSNKVFLFNAADGAALKEFLDPNLTGPDKKKVAASHLSLVESMAFSPDGKTLATGSFRKSSSGTSRKPPSSSRSRASPIASSLWRSHRTANTWPRAAAPRPKTVRLRSSTRPGNRSLNSRARIATPSSASLSARTTRCSLRAGLTSS